MRARLEVCVDSPEGLRAAVEGGAHRIELCAALDVGGLTPSPGLMALAARVPIPVYAMVRPRAGSFCFQADDAVSMIADIDAARNAGLAGVVIGASLPNGNLDLPLLRRLVDRASGLGTTLHRVFDLVPDPERSLEEAIELGCERILTSGLRHTALEGLPMLASLAKRAAGRIGIMPGSGITIENAMHILDETGVGEIHASCRQEVPVEDAGSVAFGFSKPHSFQTSANKVRQLVEAIVECPHP